MWTSVNTSVNNKHDDKKVILAKNDFTADYLLIRIVALCELQAALFYSLLLYTSFYCLQGCLHVISSAFYNTNSLMMDAHNGLA